VHFEQTSTGKLILYISRLNLHFGTQTIDNMKSSTVLASFSLFFASVMAQTACAPAASAIPTCGVCFALVPPLYTLAHHFPHPRSQYANSILNSFTTLYVPTNSHPADPLHPNRRRCRRMRRRQLLVPLLQRGGNSKQRYRLRPEQLWPYNWS
jgi:hypothetical protein